MAILTHDDELAKANPKAIVVRAEVRSVQAYKGQYNHDLRKGSIPQYVDQDRMELNRILIDPARGPELRSISKERRNKREMQRKMKSDAGVAVVGLIAFGTDAQKVFAELSVEDQDKAFRDVAKAVAARANTSLHGLIVHVDESAIHAHFVMAGYDHDGMPLSDKMKKGMLADFQSLAAEAVQEYCPEIERGRPRWQRLQAGADPADTVHRSVQELHADLPAEIAQLRSRRDAALAESDQLDARLAELKADLVKIEAEAAAATERREKNERLAAKAQSDLEEGKGHVEKVAKRAALYEARAATAAEAEAAAHDKRTAILAEIEAKAELIATGIKAVVDELVAGTLRRHPETGKLIMKDSAPARAADELLPFVYSAADAAGEIAQVKARAAADAAAAAAARVRAEADVGAVKEARRQLEIDRAEFEVERLTLADQARRLVDQVTKWIRQVQPLAADADVETETAMAVRKAFPEAKDMRQKLRDVFEALTRRGKPREGILGQMQEQADAELLRPVDAALRPLSAPPGQPGPKSGPSGLDGPGF